MWPSSAQGPFLDAIPSSSTLQNTGQISELHQTEGQLLRSARHAAFFPDISEMLWSYGCLASLRVDHSFTLHSINRWPSALKGRLYMYCTSRICPCKKCWKARQPNSRSLASESESKRKQGLILCVAPFSMCSCDCNGMDLCHMLSGSNDSLQLHYKD